MRSPWKIAIMVLAALALAGAVSGVVLAQTGGDGTPAPEERPNFVARLAENLGISQEELEAAIRQTALDLVDERVAAGDLTEEQAARIRERIESGEGLPFFGRPHHPRPHAGGYIGQEVAGFLGITLEELQQARADDQSLAQIAEANGVSRDDLIAFLVGEMEETLAAKVEAGKLDQARADEILARFQERVDDLVDRTEPLRPHRPLREGGISGRSPEVESPLL